MEADSKQELKHEQYSQKGKDASLEAISILPPMWLAQIRMILDIINRCLIKMKLSMILPRVFENPLTVYERLKGTQYEACALLLLEYLQQRKKDVEIYVGGPHCYDEKLIKLIKLFHSNHGLIELLPNWLNISTVSDHLIVEAFDLLTHIADQRMHRSAHIEVEKEKQMHKFYRENIGLRKEIEFLRRRVRSQKQHQRWKRALRSSDTFKLQDEIVQKKWQYLSAVNDVISGNAQRIKLLNFGHGNKINQLEEENKRLENEFLKLKAINAKQLKSVREEKNKLLIQLQTTIEKHDRVLGEKIKENVYLQDEYDKQHEEMEIFMEKYAALEKEFNETVNSGMAETNQRYQDRVEFFFKNRAARIIQRYWRKFLAEKKKLAKLEKMANKKGKGKGKKAKK